jgi:gluconolactonase
MKSRIALAVVLGCAAGAVSAQQPSSAFNRGNSQQSWQNPGLAAVLEKCSKKPAAFRIGGDGDSSTNVAPPPPALPTPAAIPGVIAPNQSWKVVWAWEGNNADGPIAGDDGKLLFANQDASNVMELDPATGLARVIHDNTNTGGAVTRSKNGALFVASRGLGAAILQLEPQRKVFANTVNGGEPLDCAGGVLNDLTADARGGVYLAISGGGLFYASPQGVMTQYGDGVMGPNGIILSADERTLYVTNGPALLAFDVQADGALTNQREHGRYRSGRGGDGSAIDSEGRIYVATGSAADVFSPSGEFLGTIDGPDGMHGVAFGGRDKKTLYGIVFYGGWGTPSARNQVIGIPTIAQGYTGRAK